MATSVCSAPLLLWELVGDFHVHAVGQFVMPLSLPVDICVWTTVFCGKILCDILLNSAANGNVPLLIPW